jgi:ketosteroid isomerase-like protein
MLSKDAALVLGRWHLKRAKDDPHGTFSLLFRKTKAGWRIVHDHSSSA